MPKIQILDMVDKVTSSLKASELLTNGKYPVYGAQGVSGYLNTYQTTKESIAIIKDGAGVGRVQIIPAYSSVIGTMQLLVPKSGFDVNYLYFLFDSLKLGESYSGATIPHIYFKDYSKIFINANDEKRQREISLRLSHINRLIETSNLEIEFLNELTKSRFNEMFGDPINNNLNLPLVTLSDISKLKSGKAIKTGELVDCNDGTLFPCYGGNGIRGYINRFSHEGFYPIIGRQGALAGNVSFANGKFYATEHAVVVHPKTTLNVTWYYYSLKMLNLMRFQSGAAQPGLSVEKLNDVKIPFPNLDSQNEFAIFVDQIDKLKFNVQKRIEKFKELLNKKMDEYFN